MAALSYSAWRIGVTQSLFKSDSFVISVALGDRKGIRPVKMQGVDLLVMI